MGLISAFCPINRFFTRTTFLGKPEFLLIYCCQARFSAAKMPDQTAKIPDQTAKIPDHVGWQFLTTAFIFRNVVFPQERRQFYCFWATAEISTIWKIQVCDTLVFHLSRFCCKVGWFWVRHTYLVDGFGLGKLEVSCSTLSTCTTYKLTWKT